MSLESASQLSTLMVNKDALIDDPSRSFAEKASMLGRLYMEQSRPDLSGLSPLLQTLRPAINAATGVGIGLGMAKAFKSFFSGDSMDKTAQAREAFRFGFVKAACEAGYFTKTAFNPLSIVVDPIMGVSSAMRGLGEATGSAVGALDSAGEADERLTRLKVETELLRQQKDRLEAERRNALLKKLLAQRISGSTVHA